jgi:predicted RNase H-like nuclease (RuvC/YqgF family)
VVKKVILCLVGLFLLTGCCSTRKVDRQILKYQRQIDQLESELRARDRAIDSSIRELEAISERSRGMEADIDDIIRELDEYQRAVERLIQNYRTGKAEEPETDQGTLGYIADIPDVSSYSIIYIIPGTNSQD